jgi:hypothetical protein
MEGSTGLHRAFTGLERIIFLDSTDLEFRSDISELQVRPCTGCDHVSVRRSSGGWGRRRWWPLPGTSVPTTGAYSRTTGLALDSPGTRTGRIGHR